MSDWMTDILNNSTSNILAQGQPQNSKQQYLQSVICRPYAVDNRDRPSI